MLLLAQGLAVLLYLFIEERRSDREEPLSLQYEVLSGEEEAPELMFLQGGREARLSEYRGRPVLLHFWATWCAPCLKELPLLLPLARTLEDSRGLALLAVNTNDTWSAVERFFKGNVPPAFVWDATGEGAERFGVLTIPDTYLISPEGKLLLRFPGPQDWSSPRARALLEEALGR